MLELQQSTLICVSQGYEDLAHELCQVGILFSHDQHGPAGPYHIIQVRAKFVVLKRYNSIQQSELTGSISIAHDHDGALRLALDYGSNSDALARWLVIPLPADGKCEWHTTAIANSPVSSRDIATEISRRLMFRW